MRYRDSGVNIDAARRAKRRIRVLARQTFNRRVLRDVGAFGGFFALRGLPSDAVLVSSVDGVGTKLKIAFALDRHSTVGADLVNHCVNDIAAHGAEPLFFLDYLATGRLRPDVVVEVVRGVAGACRAVGCALVGGETAEMPGFYPENQYDLAGTIVGWVRRRDIIDGAGIRPGDAILGLPALGLHTNGYSLARQVLLERRGMSLSAHVPELGDSLGDALLAPHRCYWPIVKPLIKTGRLKGIVHVTGGGLTENTPRVLPAGCYAEIWLGSWPVLPIFDLIQRLGGVPEDDMFRTFNMGLGLLLVVAEQHVPQAIAMLKKRHEKVWRVGRIGAGRAGVRYVPAGERSVGRQVRR